jgi:methanogenic corrinoid protein MtbC1
MGLEELVKMAEAELGPVDAASAEAYAGAAGAMTDRVNRAMEARDDLEALTGGSPVEMVRDNHRNHASFIAGVLRFEQWEMLVRTVAWVYRAYASHGFSGEYFPAVLREWRRAVSDHLPPPAAAQVLPVYDWMLKTHGEMLRACGEASAPPPAGGRWEPVRRRFSAALLGGDHRTCLAIAEGAVDGNRSIGDFYLKVLQPSMHGIGRLWESGQISVAQEHLASSIVGRVMTSVYLGCDCSKPRRGSAVVSAAPEEYHEIGCWMVSDMLEMDGWRVRYLGADTPAGELLDFLREDPPDVLALSVTMPFNIDSAAGLVRSVRDEPSLASVRILLGGAAVSSAEGLWRRLGADGTAFDAAEAVEVCRRWADAG